MIEKMAGLPHGVFGLRVGSCLTAHDYAGVITPVVDEATRAGGRLRCLNVIEPDFSGLTPPPSPTTSGSGCTPSGRSTASPTSAGSSR